VLMILLMMVGAAIGLATKGNIKPLVGVVILGFIFMALALG
jgi:pyruvate/2-oxoglutarate/acetoin dehydrogenase E1 component